MQQDAQKKPIYLIGFMASGKSSVAAQLSKKLGLPLREMDQLISEKAGMPIPEIFSVYGEEHFRDMETAFLRELSLSEGVISCGGGLPLREENRRILRETGLAVYLEAEPGTILGRLERGQTERPLLSGRVNREEIAAMLGKRRKLYEQAAALRVSADAGSPEEIAERILALL